jgi:hypothetical protein
VRGDFTERRYSDDEFRRIIEQATLPEQESEHVAGGGRGHTLAEIRDIAREVGIDPDRIDRAAADLVASEPDARATSSAGLFPRVLHAERVIPRALTDGEMERVVRQAELVARQPGRLRRSGGWAEWRDDRDRLYVGVARGTDVTRIRVIIDQTADLVTGGTTIGVLAALLVAAGAGSASPLFAPGALLVAGVAIGLIGFFARWRTRTTRTHMSDLLDILEDTIREAR